MFGRLPPAWGLVVFLLSGCAGMFPGSSSGHGEATWREYELGDHGIFAAFPEPPEESPRFENELGSATRYFWGAGDDDGFFAVARTQTDPENILLESDVEARCRASLNSIESQRDVTLGRFQGREYRGKVDDLASLQRCFWIGDSLLLLMFVGDELHPEKVERFLSSVRLEMPWREDRVAVGEFSVAIPAWSVLVSSSDVKWGDDTEKEGHWLGGIDGVSYWYNAIPLDEEDLALPPDELIDRYIAAAGSPYDRQVRLDHDDLRARDVFNPWLRARLLVSDTHLYSMAMHSKDPALLTGEDAERFFASFHRFESKSN